MGASARLSAAVGGAVVALHAAAVDGTVAGVVAYESMVSYRSVVEAPRHVHPVSDFLPNVLLHYDLPDLAAALAPARVLVAAPQDAMGMPLSDGAAAAAYSRPQRMAALLGGEVAVQANPMQPEEGLHAGIVEWVSATIAHTVASREEHARAGR